MGVPNNLHQEKIDPDLYSRIQAADAEATFHLLVTYRGPRQETEVGRYGINEAIREYMGAQVKYYEESGVPSYAPSELLGTIAANLQKRHVDDLLQNEEVELLVDGNVKLELIE